MKKYGKYAIGILIVCLCMTVMSISVYANSTKASYNDLFTDKGTVILRKDKPEDLVGTFYNNKTNTTPPVYTWNDEPVFKDKTLEKIVYNVIYQFYTDLKAIVDVSKTTGYTVNADNITFTNTNMRQILSFYVGDIDAKWKTGQTKIESASGIQFLTHVRKLHLEKNDIKDWTDIDRNGIWGPNHYGGDLIDPATGNVITENPIDNEPVEKNVYWYIDGNPFTLLPPGFGGNLCIKQPGTTSSTYTDIKDEELVFLRRDNMATFGGTLNVKRCEIIKKTELNGIITQNREPAKIVAVNVLKEAGETAPRIEVKSEPGGGYHQTEIEFIGLKKTGYVSIGIGVDQDIKYDTSDEYDTVTPGSQSFKYYIKPTLKVYDTVSLDQDMTAGFSFTKTNSKTNQTVSGAIYTLYQGSTVIKEALTTDKDGRITVTNLPVGSYSLKETKAPTGYELNPTSIDFTLEVPVVKVTGGTKSVIPTETKVAINAKENETFIAGDTNDAIELSCNNEEAIKEIKVEYTALDPNGVASTKTFSSLLEAQNDINKNKMDNIIIGNVKVTVAFNESLTKTIKGVNTPLTPTGATPPDDYHNSKVPTMDAIKIDGWIMLTIASISLISLITYSKKHS